MYKSLFKQSRLESYFASGVAGDAFVLAVEFDLVVVQFVFARENGIDDLLAGDVLYLSAREVKAISEFGSLLVVETAEHGLPDETALFVGEELSRSSLGHLPLVSRRKKARYKRGKRDRNLKKQHI